MLVDYHFTRTLRDPWSVNVPSNGFVIDFLGRINALDWDELDRVSGAYIRVWKLTIPQPGES